MSTLAELGELYLATCELEGKSPNTVRAYRETVGRFLRSHGELEPAALRTDHIADHLRQFGHLSPETRHRYFREVRRFCGWLVELEYLDASPFRGLRNLRLPQRIVRPYTTDEIERVLAATRPTAAGARDRAMVLVLLDSGPRCAELIQTRLDDLSVAERRLRIMHGKGGTQRVVPFAERCAGALDEYLLLRGERPGPLFLAATGAGDLRSGVPLQTSGLKQMLRRLGARAGVERVYAHRFRHTFANWAIAHDARELDVQHLLGHATGNMVRRYSSAYRSEQAAQRHAAFSPADQMLS